MSSISGNRETGGRPLSTADLAAAARRPDAVVDDNEKPVLNEERIPATDREERMQRQSAGNADAQQRAPGTRPAEEPEAQPRGRWFSESGTSSADRPPDAVAAHSGDTLEALFTPQLTETYRSRWISIQSGFVDDPRQAVRSGDELVAQIMTDLANTFAEERHRVEAQLDAKGEGSTEELRVTLRRYRSFFERLLSL